MIEVGDIYETPDGRWQVSDIEGDEVVLAAASWMSARVEVWKRAYIERLIRIGTFKKVTP